MAHLEQVKKGVLIELQLWFNDERKDHQVHGHNCEQTVPSGNAIEGHATESSCHAYCIAHCQPYSSTCCRALCSGSGVGGWEERGQEQWLQTRPFAWLGLPTTWRGPMQVHCVHADGQLASRVGGWPCGHTGAQNGAQAAFFGLFGQAVRVVRAVHAEH